MRYGKICRGTFLARPNRFVARVELEGKVETVHVKNTGRCRELLLPGSAVILTPGENPARKTPYDLIGVYKEGLGWVNIDSAAPNRAVAEWLAARPAPFEAVTLIRPEFTHGASRVDFYMEAPGRQILLEVKGCTLEIDGVGYFPDAPTERGVKHLHELAAAQAEGWECYIAFVIAMPGVTEVRPNMTTHPAFGLALQEAQAAGVRVLHLPCRVTPEELEILR